MMWILEEGDDGSSIFRPPYEGVIAMETGDNEVSKGIIPVYSELGDIKEFVGYGEFEKETGLLRFTIDTESDIKHLLGGDLLGLSIYTNKKEEL